MLDAQKLSRRAPDPLYLLRPVLGEERAREVFVIDRKCCKLNIKTMRELLNKTPVNERARG